jgi:DNA polymerase zeta
MFSVRIVTTDHYQSTPIPGLDVQYSDLKGSDVWKVPVVKNDSAAISGL